MSDARTHPTLKGGETDGEHYNDAMKQISSPRL